MPPRPSPFPGGFRATFLDALLRSDESLAARFAVPDRGDRDHALAWFWHVDQMLRNSPDHALLLSLVRTVDQLRGASSWQKLLDALSKDACHVTRLRREQGALRSVWGVTPIISLTTSVTADRALGIAAESLVFTTYYVTSKFDINLSEHVKVVLDNNAGLVSFSWLVLIWAMLTYDIFFYFNDRGILPPTEWTGRFWMGIQQAELGLLRSAEKYIYMLPYGADYRTRQRTIANSKFNFCMDCPAIGEFCFCNDEVWPLVFHTIAAYATATLATGLSARHLPDARRFDYIVVDTEAIRPSYVTIEAGRKLRVLHVPNHPHFKGTRYLKEAVDRLSKEGAAVEFTFASGIGNDEVLRLMRQSDVVVDQLIGGNFGQTALEAMALGKPVIVYIADLDFLQAFEECPLINANPDTIYDVLLDLANDPARLEGLGRQSRRYVEKHYSVATLSERLRELYRETAGIDVDAKKSTPSSIV